MTKQQVKTKNVKSPNPPIKPAKLASDTPLEALGLSTHINSPLKEAGLKTVQDILDKLAQGEDALTAIRGIKDTRLETIKKQLSEKGFVISEQTGAVTSKYQPPGLDEELKKPDEPALVTIAEKPHSKIRVENGSERRFSFIVRLTVDEQGRALRGEIEHGQSGARNPFSRLDGQKLANFIESTIQSLMVEEGKPSVEAAPEKPETPKAAPTPPAPDAVLSILNVRLTNSVGDEAPGGVLASGADYWIQVNFKLAGAEAANLAAQGTPCEIRIYARPMATESANVPIVHRLMLEEGRFDYSPKIRMPDLEPGVYGFVTLAALQTPAPIGGFLEGPIFEVVKERLPSMEVMIV